MHNYPTWNELSPADQDAAPLCFLSSAILHALDHRIAPMASARSQEVRQARIPKSRYVGVILRHGRWTARWTKGEKVMIKMFGVAPEDELKAARYRARRVGLKEPEVRLI